MGRTVSSARQTAQERRDAILDLAIVEFAARGLHGGSTERIAAEAGISQPYVFRLFGTKKELFLAAVERVCDRIMRAFQQAAASTSGGPAALHAMGQVWLVLLARRAELLLLLQSYAAADDPDVRAISRHRYAELRQYVQEASGADAEQLRRFFGYGMLSLVATAIDLPELFSE